MGGRERERQEAIGKRHVERGRRRERKEDLNEPRID
jgi:hypothetical protein